MIAQRIHGAKSAAVCDDRDWQIGGLQEFTRTVEPQL
jgi:hypothetical protein